MNETDVRDIPAGWRWVSFSEAAEHRLGKMLDKGKNVGTLRPYLRNVNVRWHGFDLSDIGEMRVGDDEMNKYSVRKGDLVICEGGEPGRAAIWQRDEPIAYQKAVHRARPREGVEAKWLLYLLEHEATSGRLAEHFTGSTINHLTGKALANVRVPLAPLAEQRRIVDAIEELFSDLDAGEAALRDARRRLVRYRQSVLNAAVTGTLTEAWRDANPDAEPAEALLSRALAKRPASKKQRPNPVQTDLAELPAGWTWATIDQIGEVKSGLTKNKSIAGVDVEEVSYLRVANVQRGFIDLGEVKSITASKSKIDATILEKGDVLFNEGGDLDKLGRGWIWEGQLPRCSHQNHVFRVRLIADWIQPKIISWIGNTIGRSHFAEHGKQTTNLASINQSVLRSMPVPLPPAAEQVAIVEEAERRLSVADAVAADVDAQLVRSKRLRRSILQRAFEGHLVPQQAPAPETPPSSGPVFGRQTTLAL